MKLRPSHKEIVLTHLRRNGSITPVEALIVHKIARLAPRIMELRDEGHDIHTMIRTDFSGAKYSHYELQP